MIIIPAPSHNPANICNCEGQIKKLSTDVQIIKKIASQHLVGLDKLSNHLNINIDTDSLDIFPIMSMDDLDALNLKLSDTTFYSQVV